MKKEISIRDFGNKEQLTEEELKKWRNAWVNYETFKKLGYSYCNECGKKVYYKKKPYGFYYKHQIFCIPCKRKLFKHLFPFSKVW